MADAAPPPLKNARYVRRLGPHHFAYLRAFAEGLEPVQCARHGMPGNDRAPGYQQITSPKPLLVRIDVPTDVWAQVTMIDIASHIGWDALPVGMVSINWGTKWCANMTSALALVPSVVVPEEFNVLLNPVHADAAKLKATKIRKWLYDPRAVGQ